MPEIWFISGPPFDTAIWRAVEARVHDLGCCARTWPCLTAGSGDIAEEVVRLSADLDSVEHDIILVGHGSALPMVRASSTHPRVAGIVLSNGPGPKLDRLNRLWTRLFSMPQPLRKGVLGTRAHDAHSSVIRGPQTDSGESLRDGPRHSCRDL